MNNQEYWDEVNEIADIIAYETMQETDNNRDEAEEIINDTCLHETIDGHQWIIYYGYNLDVIGHSENADYYADIFGGDSLAASLDQAGLDMLHCHIAFWAMYVDVQDRLPTALDEYEEALDIAE